MNLRVPKMRGISWLAAEPVSFSRRTLLHGVCKWVITFSFQIPAAAPRWPGKMKGWIIVSRWHSCSSPEGKEGHHAVRRRLCCRRWWYRRSSKQKNQAALADTATLVLETFGSLTTELSRLITVIFFPRCTFNPSLPLRVLRWHCDEVLLRWMFLYKWQPGVVFASFPSA